MRPLLLLPLVACNAASIALDKPGETGEAPDSDSAPATAPVYVHDADTLYAWDAAKLSALPIAPFADAATGSPITGFSDLAIDAEGTLYGAAAGTLYRVNPRTGGVSAEQVLPDQGTGLGFLPDGRLIVAGMGLAALDLATGAVETLVPGGAFVTSGDVVATPDGLVHWTVTTTGGDAWVVFDPTTHQTDVRGLVGTSELWGVAWSEERLWAFSAAGEAWTVDPSTGHGTLAATGGAPWYGATTNPVTW